MLKLRILFLAANPSDTGKLQLDREVREIENRIRGSAERDRLELVSRWAVRPDDLLLYLNEYRPHVVHFSGHGSTAGQLVLEDDQRHSFPLRREAVGRLFRVLADDIRLVVLNACFSLEQAQAIADVIGCAIGTPKEIGDEAAIAFAAAFYQAIGFGRSVREAFDQGRIALDFRDTHEDGSPQLTSGRGVDPGSLILVGQRSVLPRPLDAARDEMPLPPYKPIP